MYDRTGRTDSTFSLTNLAQGPTNYLVTLKPLTLLVTEGEARTLTALITSLF